MSESKKRIIFIGSILLAAIFFFLITGNPEEESSDTNLHAAIELAETESLPMEPQTAIVDVKGAVKNPGVYEVGIDSRVHHVIQLAGGFTDEADTNQINLAQKVHDEMSIIVWQIDDNPTSAGGSTTSANSGGKVRINYATQEELETLNGIGPTKAKAIIQYREEHGLFERPEDLLNVSGIGEKTLQNFIDQIQVP